MALIQKWRIKALVQKAISVLPFKERINYWFQKNVTKGVQLTDAHFEEKLIHASNHLKRFTNSSEKPLNQSLLLEIGTGWHPVIPLAMYLSGIGKIYTLDVRDWMRKETLNETLQRFREWQADGRLQKYLPEVKEARWKNVLAISNRQNLSIDEIFRRIEINRIIGDARKTDFENESVDLVCSNNTFEHIPTEILKGIIKELSRITSNGAVMSHFIDMEDRYSHFDANISAFNFLQFSDRQWKRIDNTLLPLNRLRFVDYQAMLLKAGFEPIAYTFKSGNVEALRELVLAPEFQSYSEAELLVVHGEIESIRRIDYVS